MKRRNVNRIYRFLALFLALVLICSPVFAAGADDAPEGAAVPAIEQETPEAEVPEEKAPAEAPEELVPAQLPEKQAQPAAAEETVPEKAPAKAEPETPEALYARLKGLTEEEREAALRELDEEQVKALYAYAWSLEEHVFPETVVLPGIGPLLPAIKVLPALRSLKKGAQTMGNTRGGSAPDGLGMSKEMSDDGSKITLEVYTTGEVISHEISSPVDIVLVLDQSGSMRFGFDTNTEVAYANSRQKAMKDAVLHFISNVHEKYDASSDHRVAIVTFGTNASNLAGWTFMDDAGTTALTNAVNGLTQTPSGATRVDLGMQNASALLDSGYSYTGPNTSRQTAVIVFTDGVPTAQSDFQTNVANTALTAAQTIKDNGAAVFSIGIFGGANPDQLHGDKWDYALFSDIICTGQPGSYWGGSWAASMFGNANDFDVLDVPACNRFLNYLSTNAPNATKIGITKGTDFNPGDHWFAGGTGWRIDENSSCDTSKKYYKTANNASGLDTIFQSIAEQIATPTIDLGSETVIKDILSPQLQLPEGATADSVSFYTQAYLGGGDFENPANWGSKVAVTDGSVHLTPGEDDKTVNVTGFNFNDNVVTEEPKADGTRGKKLVIEIAVESDPNFLGGTIPTNGEGSGVYVPGSDTPIGTFDKPTHQYPMKEIDVEEAERNIYMATEDELADTLGNLVFTIGGTEIHFEDLFDGVNNAGVDYELRIIDEDDNVVGIFRIPAGKTPSDEGAGWVGAIPPILTAHDYEIDSLVSDVTCPPYDPRLDPDSPEYDPNAPQPQKFVGHVQLNVFHPVLTFTDKHVYYGGAQIDVAAVEPEEKWECELTDGTVMLDTEVDMDTTKPTLAYEYIVYTDTSATTEATGTMVDQTGDYIVKLDMIHEETALGHLVELLPTYEPSIEFRRSCASENMDAVLVDAAEENEQIFHIHVITPTLTFEDKNVYYMGDAPADTIYAPEVTWDTPDGVTMDNTAPTFTYTYTGAPAGTIDQTADYTVGVTVMAGENTVPADGITVRCDCAVEQLEGEDATADAAFLVHVYVPTLTFEDKNVYFKGTAPADTAYAPEVTWASGDNAAPDQMDNTAPTFTYTYTGTPTGTIDQTTDYSVGVTVKVGEATVDGITFKRSCETEELDAADATADEAFEIHVFTPSYAFEDMVKYYGEEITLPTAYTPTWTHPELDAPAAFDNAAPELTVIVTPAANAVQNGYVWATEDFGVKAEIRVGATDITSDVIERCTRTCAEDASHDAPTVDEAYVVHVKTLSVTVQKLIKGLFADKSKSYEFAVSFAPNGTGAPTYTADNFTLGDNETTTLTGLPLGTLTITENGVADGYTVKIEADGSVKFNGAATDGSASADIALAKPADNSDEPVSVVVTNTMEDIPITGIFTGMPGLWFVVFALCGLAALAVAVFWKRNVLR